jgi:hypothetical protein
MKVLSMRERREVWKSLYAPPMKRELEWKREQEKLESTSRPWRRSGPGPDAS